MAGAVRSETPTSPTAKRIMPTTLRSPRWGFGGHVPDLDARLLYMGARFYDERLGLFLSPDTVMPDPVRTQAHNRYTFAFNNPINNTDPTGHAPVVIPILTAMATSAAVVPQQQWQRS